MTATIETIITCDGREPDCAGTFCGSDARHLSAKQQRSKYATEDDPTGVWHYYRGKDYCPICWAARKSHSANELQK